jgi:synaptojanin
MYKDLID